MGFRYKKNLFDVKNGSFRFCRFCRSYGGKHGRFRARSQILTRQNLAIKGSFSSGWFALHKNLPILKTGVSTYMNLYCNRCKTMEKQK